MADHSRPATGYPAATGYPPPPAQYTNNHPNGQTFSTAGTAYPYAAPPPQNPYYNPNPYHGPDPYAAQRATFVRRLLSILIASIVITGTIVFIVWLVLRPKIPDFKVTSVTLSNFNLSSSSLITGNWDVRFTVRNPNHKITLAYDHIEAYVFYQSDEITETSVPPFVQGTKNETEVRATFAVLSAYVDQKVGDRIAADRARGSVNFNVRMLARVRFRAGAWRARRRLLSVVCGDLSVTVSSSSNGGSLVGGSRNCKVGL